MYVDRQSLMTPEEFTSKLVPPLREMDHTRGPASAAVVLMEYGDFQSPQSGKAYTVVKSLQQNLGDRICFVFRHFPQTNLYPQALKASETAEVAAVQGKFWEMHDQLFEHQSALSDGDLVAYAVQIGLDIPQMLQELATHTHLPRIQADIETGTQYGVQHTPTFFVGIRHQGAENLESLIRQILKIEVGSDAEF